MWWGLSASNIERNGTPWAMAADDLVDLGVDGGDRSDVVVPVEPDLE